MMDPEVKAEIIRRFQIHENDSGSPEVQVALLTWDIRHLTEHLKVHKKDFASRRGLLMKVGRRNTLLRYLEKKDYDRYVRLKERLELKR